MSVDLENVSRAEEEEREREGGGGGRERAKDGT